jgi:hypothetical protein
MAKTYPIRMILPTFDDKSMGAEEGSKTVQGDNILPALDCGRGIDEELILFSTRAKDENGKWQTSVGAIPLAQMEDGNEIHLSGKGGDRFKLVVSRALRWGVDPKAPSITADVPFTPMPVSIGAANAMPLGIEQVAKKKASSAASFLMLAGLFGGAIYAALAKAEPSARVQSVPEPIDEEVVLEALEETV